MIDTLLTQIGSLVGFSDPAHQRLAISGLIVAAVVVASLFFSFAQGLFLRLFGDVRDRAKELRTAAMEGSGRWFDAATGAFWAARTNEPRAPIVSELTRLNRAVDNVGTRQVEALARTETRVKSHLQALMSIQAPDSVDTASDRERIVSALSGTSITSLVLLIAFAVVIGGVNSFLLAIFFREVIGSYRVLPYPLPDLQASNVIASIIFISEVVAGWAIYRSGVSASDAERPKHSGDAFFRAIPWVLLVALAVVELAAYSTLSVRVGLAKRLAMDPAGPLYGFAEYFLAFLGIGLTLILAYLGHAVAEGIDHRRRSRAARELLRTLRRGKDSALEQVAKLRELVASIRPVVADFPRSIPGEFHRALGVGKGTQPVLETAERFLLGAVTSAEPAAAAAETLASAPLAPLRPPARTTGQVWGDMLLSVFCLVVLLAVATLTGFEVVSYFMRATTPMAVFIAWAAGFGVPAAIIALSAVGWSVVGELRHASLAPAALPERRGQLFLGWFVVGALTALTAVLVSFAVVISGGTAPVLYALLALAQAVSLIGLSGLADQGLVAIVHLAQLAGIALVRVAALVLAAIASVVDMIGWTLGAAVRLLAIPGDVLRGRLLPPMGRAAGSGL